MSLRIAFFGTPDFAVPSLRALLGEGFDVAVVVTQPDRPQGRSRSQLVPPPVKEVAREHGLPVLQPDTPSTPDAMDALRAYAPDLGVVVAYGHILKPDLLALPTRGMVNVHASLLPALRGAAPIQHALLQGLETTGVSIMQLDEGMDTGPVLLTAPTPIAPDETAGELTERLAELGAMALIEALALHSVGELRPAPQDHERATYAPKIDQEQARVRWEEPADRIARQLRALDPRPGAWTTYEGKRLKLFGAREGGPTDAAPGTVLEVKPGLIIATGQDALQVLDVQPEGKGRMGAPDWARGRAITPGARLG
ncbi:MAG: methionyl-tRNA formyltransferase [Gemmatimonadales bacterium]